MTTKERKKVIRNFEFLQIKRHIFLEKSDEKMEKCHLRNFS